MGIPNPPFLIIEPKEDPTKNKSRQEKELVKI